MFSWHKGGGLEKSPGSEACSLLPGYFRHQKLVSAMAKAFRLTSRFTETKAGTGAGRTGGRIFWGFFRGRGRILGGIKPGVQIFIFKGRKTKCFSRRPEKQNAWVMFLGPVRKNYFPRLNFGLFGRGASPCPRFWGRARPRGRRGPVTESRGARRAISIVSASGPDLSGAISGSRDIGHLSGGGAILARRFEPGGGGGGGNGDMPRRAGRETTLGPGVCGFSHGPHTW